MARGKLAQWSAPKKSLSFRWPTLTSSELTWMDLRRKIRRAKVRKLKLPNEQ